MCPYEQLRRRAVEKRDNAIRAARAEYREDLRAIEVLTRSIPSDAPKRPKKPTPPTVQLIVELMPKDRPFTIPDLLGILRTVERGRLFHEPSVRTYVSRLARRGVLKKLHRTDGNYSLWAATGVADHPFGQKTLAEIAAQLIGERGPMRTTEIVVAAQAMGYRAETTPHALARAFRDAFRREHRRFSRRDDGAWGMV